MNAKEVQAFFERVATDWDTMCLAYYDEAVIEKMAAVCGVDHTTTVADVGTGTGFVAAGLAPRVGRVIAVDNSRAMLDVARKNLDALGIGNVELLLGEITTLPLESACVDAACANRCCTTPRTLRRCSRRWPAWSQLGGTVVITDEVDHPYAWMQEEHADIWLGFNEEQIKGFFREARLGAYGYESLGMQ